MTACSQGSVLRLLIHLFIRHPECAPRWVGSGQCLPERTWNLLWKTLWLVLQNIFMWITISFCQKLFAWMPQMFIKLCVKGRAEEQSSRTSWGPSGVYHGLECHWPGGMDPWAEWFPTCVGPSSPWKTILGLIRRGKDQQKWCFFLPCLFRRIGLSLRFLENKMAEFVGKEA